MAPGTTPTTSATAPGTLSVDFNYSNYPNDGVIRSKDAAKYEQDPNFELLMPEEVRELQKLICNIDDNSFWSKPEFYKLLTNNESAGAILGLLENNKFCKLTSSLGGTPPAFALRKGISYFFMSDTGDETLQTCRIFQPIYNRWRTSMLMATEGDMAIEETVLGRVKSALNTCETTSPQSSDNCETALAQKQSDLNCCNTKLKIAEDSNSAYGNIYDKLRKSHLNMPIARLEQINDFCGEAVSLNGAASGRRWTTGAGAMGTYAALKIGRYLLFKGTLEAGEHMLPKVFPILSKIFPRIFRLGKTASLGTPAAALFVAPEMGIQTYLDFKAYDKCYNHIGNNYEECAPEMRKIDPMYDVKRFVPNAQMF